MKKLKINLSKTSWIILSVGVFIVVLAGLGVTYSQQLKKSSEANDELELTEMRLAQYNIEELRQQESELLALFDASLSQHDSDKTIFQQSIESIDVTYRCYYIASLTNVEIIDIGTTEVKAAEFIGLDCDMILIQVKVRGELADMVNFIINMNDGFNTGYIEATQTVTNEDAQYTTVQIIVYSYKGE